MHSRDDSGMHSQEVFGCYSLLIAQVHLISILKPRWVEWHGHEHHSIPAVGIVVRVVVVSVVFIVPVVGVVVPFVVVIAVPGFVIVVVVVIVVPVVVIVVVVVIAVPGVVVVIVVPVVVIVVVVVIVFPDVVAPAVLADGVAVDTACIVGHSPP